MTRLMEEVLLLGRVESGKMQCRPEATDLPAFCRRIVEEQLAATQSRCLIEFAARDLPRRTRADEGLVRHILGNLLSNAVKYSPAGKPVRFTVRRDGPMAVFEIVDQGIGIPEEDQPRLFEAFHRGTNVGEIPGTGLGMVIVKRCADLHGGTVHVASRLGDGTTIIVRLPLFARSK
jgi:signal transduction histidine kinase